MSNRLNKKSIERYKTAITNPKTIDEYGIKDFAKFFQFMLTSYKGLYLEFNEFENQDVKLGEITHIAVMDLEKKFRSLAIFSSDPKKPRATLEDLITLSETYTKQAAHKRMVSE